MEYGRRCGRWLKSKKTVLSLVGDLGAGKTTFVKGVAEGLGVGATIKSPTFVMLKEYEYSQGWLIHVDAYRLSGNFEDIGLSDYFGRANVLIEWADNISGLMPSDAIEIVFEHISKDKRKICFDRSLVEVINV